MATFTKISDLPTTSSLSDSDKFIVETSTGTKACSRSVLREATVITKEDVGLGNCDNTSDINKPISTATQAALDAITTSYLPSATAATTYLSQTDAASTYLTQNNASGTYLSKTDAATYYITQESAGSLFVTQTEAASVYVTATEAANTYLTTTAAASTYATPSDITSGITTSTYTVLTTDTQTITGAINELNGLVAGVETLLSQV
jgi:hypothetical protein